MEGSSPATVAAPVRSRRDFGGLLPAGTLVRAGSTTLAALAVELYAEGALIPLLVLTDNPGPLALDVADGVVVSDERGGHYAAAPLAEHPGLGMLQVDLWVTPAPPADVRRLQVSVAALSRTAITRRGEPVSRPLSGGPWELTLELVPARTAIPQPPAEPGLGDAAPGTARVPLRSRAGLRDIIPIGQARLERDRGLCLWALERYEDRGVLSLSVLGDARERVAAPPVERIALWDDRGRHYRVGAASSTVRPGGGEPFLEISPAVGEDARALGLRVTRPDRADGDASGEILFGVRVEATA